MSYQVKDYTHLVGMKGLSEELLKNHFNLYQGYVKNSNKITENLEKLLVEGRINTPEYSEQKRRLAWELDGMRLHELYFENLGGQGIVNDKVQLLEKIAQNFGSYAAWEEDFKATATIRGIGWAVLYQDKNTGALNNFWIDEHHIGHPVNRTPLLVLDAWEHAYLLNYGLNRVEYIKAFFENIDWDVVAQRGSCE
jgi:Fe-Mn family superoxide dismutase